MPKSRVYANYFQVQKRENAIYGEYLVVSITLYNEASL